MFASLALFAALPFASTTTVEIVETVWEETVWEDVAPAASSVEAIARFGVFHVETPTRAVLIGTVDSASPAHFRAMRRAFPRIDTLVMLDCHGSVNESANLALARAVRRAGIATHVPAGGSVRSGGVELFLAGARRSAEEGAEFLVHSWRDEDGLEARDYPAGDPVHREYIDYYAWAGLDADRAARFYALTNSVPFASSRAVSLGELKQFGILH